MKQPHGPSTTSSLLVTRLWGFASSSGHPSVQARIFQTYSMQWVLLGLLMPDLLLFIAICQGALLIFRHHRMAVLLRGWDLRSHRVRRHALSCAHELCRQSVRRLSTSTGSSATTHDSTTGRSPTPSWPASPSTPRHPSPRTALGSHAAWRAERPHLLPAIAARGPQQEQRAVLVVPPTLLEVPTLARTLLTHAAERARTDSARRDLPLHAHQREQASADDVPAPFRVGTALQRRRRVWVMFYVLLPCPFGAIDEHRPVRGAASVYGLARLC
ncbi:hypothetical protein PHLGIDRAFT_291869 [Phlebiopsis gigantea 11061_1 CR5-6]|uniref:Uncharacterized protein n=1 Tax=Phlebiopsis gigantea (strain 11061_1 CR5-6) TaxID=745531 RepID=A0A0C3RR80_PHLG1|nr:hypothetical protein PHLGIDRAFT_291869 [Phlebiopsis gigantea 11061_1 CR5-6]